MLREDLLQLFTITHFHLLLSSGIISPVDVQMLSKGIIHLPENAQSIHESEGVFQGLAFREVGVTLQ